MKHGWIAQKYFIKSFDDFPLLKNIILHPFIDYCYMYCIFIDTISS